MKENSSLTRRMPLESALAVPLIEHMAAAAGRAGSSPTSVLPALPGEGLIPPESSPPSAWVRACAAWDVARGAHEAFIEQALVPAGQEHQRIRSGDAPEDAHAAFLRVAALEEQGGELVDQRFAALHALIATPAPDPPAFLTKLRAAWEDIYRHDDPAGTFAAILADGDRLLGQGAEV